MGNYPPTPFHFENEVMQNMAKRKYAGGKGHSGMHSKLETPSAPFNIKGRSGKRGKGKSR